ncbi:MAG: sialate O-acetylesterase [Akkermansiaceae bacterium]|nr:sialate O-acetylesterase [Akkermansiaceae bacterium]
MINAPISRIFSTMGVLAALSIPAAAQDAKPKVKVYILAGQSNMVGIGKMYGSGQRWGDEFKNVVVSAYEGDHDPEADYSELEPIQTITPEKFGGTKPTPYPDGGVRVARGTVTMEETGVYEFRPGYGDSQNCIMTVAGTEVHRQEPGGEPVRKQMKIEAGKTLPFEIIYLTKGANGLGWYERVDIPGTLSTVVKEQGKFPYLLAEDGNWAVRDDVWYKGVVTATNDTWLKPGCGAGKDSSIGPELGFGHILGEHHEEPVLLIKASQGNRSLNWDFLPPGSERFEVDGVVYAGYGDKAPSWEKGSEPKEVNWYAGKQYDDCFGAAKDVLANFDKSIPAFAGHEYEIAGFVWWQGHKDSGSMVTAKRYEHNLVHLIKTLRKEFDAPGAPFVVGTIGFGGMDMEKPEMLTIVDAQLAVDGETGKYPDFKGNVKSVDTRPFWIPAEQSPKEQDFHYNQNAETYMNVGLALGQAMVDLLKK